MSCLSLQDKIITIYRHFPKMKFDFDRENYHRFFYEVSKDKRLHLFNELSFDTERYPNCVDLDEVDNILLSATFIDSFTSELNRRIIRPICRDYYERNIIRNASSLEIIKLSEVAIKFKERMNVREIFD